MTTKTGRWLAVLLAFSGAMVVCAPASADDWQGVYAGLHVGHAKGERDGKWWVLDPSLSTSFDYDTKGLLGGIQLGYNHMLNANWLLGVQGDWSWSDVDGKHRIIPGSPFSGKGEYKWISSITAKAGYLFDSKFLLYANGGLAFTRFEYSANTGYNFDENLRGWTFGLGGEYKFTPQISATLGYNRYKFGSESSSGTAFGILPAGSKADGKLNVFKIGLNYRF